MIASVGLLYVMEATLISAQFLIYATSQTASMKQTVTASELQSMARTQYG
jgi:hypothetical protein